METAIETSVKPDDSGQPQTDGPRWRVGYHWIVGLIILAIVIVVMLLPFRIFEGLREKHGTKYGIMIGLYYAAVASAVYLVYVALKVLRYVVIPTAIWVAEIEPLTCKVVTRFGGIRSAYIQPTTKKSGLIPVGLPPFGIPFVDRVYTYKSEVLIEKQDEKGNLTRTIETVVQDSISLKEQVEDFATSVVYTKNTIRVRIPGTLHFQVVDPIKALFNIENLMAAVRDRIEMSLRTYCGEKDFEDLIASSAEMQTKADSEDIIGLLRSRAENWGIKIIALGLEQVMPVDPEMITSLEAMLKAKKLAQGVMEAAKGKAFEINQINAAIKQFGEQGLVVRRLEAFEKIFDKPGTKLLSLPEVSRLLYGMASSAETSQPKSLADFLGKAALPKGWRERFAKFLQEFMEEEPETKEEVGETGKKEVEAADKKPAEAGGQS